MAAATITPFIEAGDLGLLKGRHVYLEAPRIQVTRQLRQISLIAAHVQLISGEQDRPGLGQTPIIVGILHLESGEFRESQLTRSVPDGRRFTCTTSLRRRGMRDLRHHACGGSDRYRARFVPAADAKSAPQYSSRRLVLCAASLPPGFA